jgi:hypothetical protein
MLTLSLEITWARFLNSPAICGDIFKKNKPLEDKSLRSQVKNHAKEAQLLLPTLNKTPRPKLRMRFTKVYMMTDSSW